MPADLPPLPADLTEQVEDWADPGGICGLCSIAVVAGVTLTRVLEAWEELTGEPYHVHSTVTELLAALSHFGFDVQRHTGKSVGYRWPKLDQGEKAFAKIQFGNPDDPEGRWPHYMEAMRHLHFVALAGGGDGRTYVLCNMEGDEWIPADELTEYFNETDRLSSYYIAVPRKG